MNKCELAFLLSYLKKAIFNFNTTISILYITTTYLNIRDSSCIMTKTVPINYKPSQMPRTVPDLTSGTVLGILHKRC